MIRERRSNPVSKAPIIYVLVSQCAALSEPKPPLSLRLEGIKLGQRALYRCPLGYTLQGTANATCLASGRNNFVLFIFISGLQKKRNALNSDPRNNFNNNGFSN